jgi:hypothetical protein
MRATTQEIPMSRLVAIVSLCVFLGAPTIASEGDPVPAVPPPAQAAAEATAAPTAPSSAVEQLTQLPPEILAKLDPDSIVDLLMASQGRGMVDAATGGAGVTWVAQAVPIAFFATALLVVVATLVFLYRRNAQVHETLRLMVEKGAEIPPDLLTRPKSQHGDLRRGLVLVTAGASLAIAIGLINGFVDGSWAVGLVPAFIGVGYLIVWRYSQRAESA